ncbi:MAG: hypothetical protein EKK54_06110 [Neisseriaceae bacterium]|nr:MAG: hypothetical protein EKK54_06110 [Neisseriaceae bacterium]
MNKIIMTLLVGLVLTSCSSVPVVKYQQCKTYSISGDNVEWKPVKFYQSASEKKLYIQLPEYANFEPSLFVNDPDFDRPAGVPYTYNKTTHTFRIDDNYDEYILSRTDPDTTSDEIVYIKCNRWLPLENESE